MNSDYTTTNGYRSPFKTFIVYVYILKVLCGLSHTDTPPIAPRHANFVCFGNFKYNDSKTLGSYQVVEMTLKLPDRKISPENKFTQIKILTVITDDIESNQTQLSFHDTDYNTNNFYIEHKNHLYLLTDRMSTNYRNYVHLHSKRHLTGFGLSSSDIISYYKGQVTLYFNTFILTIFSFQQTALNIIRNFLKSNKELTSENEFHKILLKLTNNPHEMICIIKSSEAEILNYYKEKLIEIYDQIKTAKELYFGSNFILFLKEFETSVKYVERKMGLSKQVVTNIEFNAFKKQLEVVNIQVNNVMKEIKSLITDKFKEFVLALKTFITEHYKVNNKQVECSDDKVNGWTKMVKSLISINVSFLKKRLKNNLDKFEGQECVKWCKAPFDLYSNEINENLENNVTWMKSDKVSLTYTRPILTLNKKSKVDNEANFTIEGYEIERQNFVLLSGLFGQKKRYIPLMISYKGKQNSEILTQCYFKGYTYKLSDKIYKQEETDDFNTIIKQSDNLYYDYLSWEGNKNPGNTFKEAKHYFQNYKTLKRYTEKLTSFMVVHKQEPESLNGKYEEPFKKASKLERDVINTDLVDEKTLKKMQYNVCGVVVTYNEFILEYCYGNWFVIVDQFKIQILFENWIKDEGIEKLESYFDMLFKIKEYKDNNKKEKKAYLIRRI